MTNNSYVSVRWQAPRGTRVRGIAALSFFDTLSDEIVAPILDKHGLRMDDFEPDGWYDYQMMMDVEREVVELDFLAPVAIGKNIATAFLASGVVTNLEDLIERQLHELHAATFQGQPEGFGYIIEKQGDKHYQITLNFPTHSYTVYGVLWEFARVTCPEGESFGLVPLTDMDSEQGATLELKWGANV